ncbi:MAG: methyltransferase domain-containing protein [Candidatus Omnitrophota bacterium]|nr:methyltransferase domain-containing protein [Candidatus Omnitrophota bacterium]
MKGLAMISKELIRRNFSNVAANYDEHAVIQKKSGCELVGQLRKDKNNYGAILDIGTGTGGLLRDLSLVCRPALICGLDISSNMLIKARASEKSSFFIQADAENIPFKKNTFDLVVSNLAYQWLMDLDSAFIQLAGILKERGMFYFTSFGRRTLSELRECLKSVKEASDYNIFPAKEAMHSKLKNAGFANIKIISKIEKEFFVDSFSLIRWLKYSGANRIGVRFNGLEARGVLKEMDKLYLEKYPAGGGVFASFERYIVKAEKR